MAANFDVTSSFRCFFWGVILFSFQTNAAAATRIDLIIYNLLCFGCFISLLTPQALQFSHWPCVRGGGSWMMMRFLGSWAPSILRDFPFEYPCREWRFNDLRRVRFHRRFHCGWLTFGPPKKSQIFGNYRTFSLDWWYVGAWMIHKKHQKVG